MMVSYKLFPEISKKLIRKSWRNRGTFRRHIPIIFSCLVISNYIPWISHGYHPHWQKIPVFHFRKVSFPFKKKLIWVFFYRQENPCWFLRNHGFAPEKSPDSHEKWPEIVWINRINENQRLQEAPVPCRFSARAVMPPETSWVAAWRRRCDATELFVVMLLYSSC